MIHSLKMEGLKVISIISSKSAKNKRAIYIGEITKSQENELDSKEPIILDFTNGSFMITPENVIAYGEIDLYDEETREAIYNFDLIEKDYINGVNVYSNFNFDENVIYNDKFYQTWDTLKVVEQGFCKIGKPKRCVLFYSNSKKR